MTQYTQRIEIVCPARYRPNFLVVNIICCNEWLFHPFYGIVETMSFSLVWKQELIAHIATYAIHWSGTKAKFSKKGIKK